jgi:hypothetical protein
LRECAIRPVDDERVRENGELRLTLPAEPAALARVRAELGRFLDRSQVGDSGFFNGLLIAHELAANAIRHGSDRSDEIELRARRRPARGPRRAPPLSAPRARRRCRMRCGK